MAPARHRSSALPLAAAYAGLIVYASLYPFAGWQWPAGRDLPELLALPMLPRALRFDEWSNLLGYLPLGALLCAGLLRQGGRALWAVAAGVAGPAVMSWWLEAAQHLVPGRVPSLRDLALNAAGAGLGAAWAWVLATVGVFDRWQMWRDRWFQPRSAGAIVLLVLWPVALLFPSPVPMGPGQLMDALREAAVALLSGTPWEADVLPALQREAQTRQQLTPLSEGMAIALGLLAPCLLAFSAMRPGWRRLAAVVAFTALGMATTALSTALNFGPAHAMTWLTPLVLRSLAVAAVVAALLSLIGPRRAAALGLVALTGLVVLVAQAPPDPYFAESLQRWHQGAFIRFHGVAQWVGWLWPYAAMGWLLSRLSRPGRNLE